MAEPTIPTLMRQEAREAPAVFARQRDLNRETVRALAAHLRAHPPRLVVTCARGSSDHAASFGKYAIETRLRRMVVSHAPSMSSLYGVRFEGLEGALFLAISQSGRSPDLLASMRAAKAAGAIVVAMVNDEASPAAGLADWLLPLRAGPEKAVAATKSYAAALLAIADLVAEWSDDEALRAAVARAPEDLAAAFDQDWSAALEPLAAASSLYVIGRGLTFGVAHEAALKLKETAALHAECHSAAEVRHGPMALARPGFPVLLFTPQDAGAESYPALVDELTGHGATVFATGGDFPGATSLPSLPGLHPLVAPIAQVLAFYGLAERLARRRGRDPDNPPGLKKVTETR
jgi:glucosamine--fructose-6-phosphate aminotransferase (isomerizing)